ncbi:MAG: isocitrate/isopropylmalate dehydrogenase family protein [Candidatus Thorarchaeota archaeon]|nr:isocitrate/isopropylmalate dehydrogenase family protein [Candidatus Thorarchaeota archaeon]
MRTYKVAILPGDGIGREVIPEAVRVLHAVQESVEGFSLDTIEYECGGEYYLRSGREWTSEAEEFCKTEADAVLLGAVGGIYPDGSTVRRPDGHLAGYSIAIGLRFDLDLYANVRPVKLYEGVPTPLAGKGPGQIDMTIVRENTEGLYVPIRGRLQRGGVSESAIDVRQITRRGSERVIRYAFELAMRRRGAPADGHRRVTCVDKSNLLAGCQLFREVYDEVAQVYPHIDRDYAYVDSWTQWCVRSPEKFDVVVAPNEFGDIITDLGAAIQGGLGMAPAGNIGDGHAVFEPVHGSAPSHYGKSQANPMAAILAAAMMLDWIGMTRSDSACTRAAALVERAVATVLREGRVRTYDLCSGQWANTVPVSTDRVGSEVAATLITLGRGG